MSQSIVIAGDIRSNSKVCDRVNAFRHLGFKVHLVNYYDTEAKRSEPSLISKIMHKIRLPLDVNNVNRALLEASNCGNKLFWLEKPNVVKPSTINLIRHNGGRVIAISEDDMCNRINNSRYFDRCVKLFDAVITTKSHNVPELILKDVNGIKYNHKTYEPTRFYPVNVTKQVYDVSFIGTYEPHRAELVKHVASSGITIYIWGNGWGHIDHENIVVKGPAYGCDFLKVTAQSKINLIFLRKSARDQHTAKSLEIPAAGGFALMEDTVEHRFYLDKYDCCDYFLPTDKNDLIKKIRFYLNDDDLRQEKQKRTAYFRQEKSFHVTANLKMLLEDLGIA